MNFEYTGEQIGVGNSSEINEYRFLDYNEQNACFYRLKQIDFDGKFEYSKIIRVDQNNDATRISYNGLLNVLQIQSGDETTLTILNVTGSIVFNRSSNASSLDLNFLKSGTYIAMVHEKNGRAVSEKIIVR